MNRRFILSIFISVLFSLLLSAETFEHKQAGLSIWFPDHWTSSSDGDMLEVTAPDGDAYIQLVALKDVDTMEAAVDIYAKEMETAFEEFTPLDDGKSLEINGLQVFYTEAEGRVDGVPMDVSLSMVVTPKAIVMILAFNSRDCRDKYESLFSKIANSVKAI